MGDDDEDGDGDRDANSDCAFMLCTVYVASIVIWNGCPEGYGHKILLLVAWATTSHSSTPFPRDVQHDVIQYIKKSYSLKTIIPICFKTWICVDGDSRFDSRFDPRFSSRSGVPNPIGPIGPARDAAGPAPGSGYPTALDAIQHTNDTRHQRGPMPALGSSLTGGFPPPMPAAPLADPRYRTHPVAAYPAHDGSHVPHHSAAAVPPIASMSVPTQPSQPTEGIVAGMADLELSQRTPLDLGDGAASQPFIDDFRSQDESQLSQQPGSMDEYLKTQNLPFTQ